MKYTRQYFVQEKEFKETASARPTLSSKFSLRSPQTLFAETAHRMDSLQASSQATESKSVHSGSALASSDGIFKDMWKDAKIQGTQLHYLVTLSFPLSSPSLSKQAADERSFGVAEWTSPATFLLTLPSTYPTELGGA